MAIGPFANSVFYVFSSNYRLITAIGSVFRNRLHLIQSVIALPLQFRISHYFSSLNQHSVAGCLIGSDLGQKQGRFSALNLCFWGQKCSIQTVMHDPQ
jgi:hypothetical protein